MVRWAAELWNKPINAAGQSVGKRHLRFPSGPKERRRFRRDAVSQDHRVTEESSLVKSHVLMSVSDPTPPMEYFTKPDSFEHVENVWEGGEPSKKVGR